MTTRMIFSICFNEKRTDVASKTGRGMEERGVSVCPFRWFPSSLCLFFYLYLSVFPLLLLLPPPHPHFQTLKAEEKNKKADHLCFDVVCIAPITFKQGGNGRESARARRRESREMR